MHTRVIAKKVGDPFFMEHGVDAMDSDGLQMHQDRKTEVKKLKVDSKLLENASA